MRQVSIAAFRAVEGHDEAVGEAFVEAFAALVRAVLETDDSENPALHAFECLEAFVDFRLRDLVLELK